jgi:saccharopine dehydrogenase-like NADP-dependent oxidoreductase
MEKRILVLGAGFVSRPLVEYLLAQPEFRLTVASRTVSKAEKIIGNHDRGIAQALDVQNPEQLDAVIAGADLVISLLPWIHHLEVAKRCLDRGKHLVTTSYVKPEMAALHEAVCQKGLIFLNEIGVDPGIDHMAAMRVIDRVKSGGGNITHFFSYCGGLPAMEHNTNPLGYKFSWSPIGVLLAASSDGRYLIDGELVEICGKDLFTHYWLVDVPGSGTFESYVNRDALAYAMIYGIDGVQSIYRGTLRNIGHCETWDCFKRIGLLSKDRGFDFTQVSPAQAIARLIGSNGVNIISDLARFLQIPEYSVTIKKLEWLGLLEDEKIPIGEATIFDMFAHVLQNKLVYVTGETDMLIQHHEFTAQYPDGKIEKICSTMVAKGTVGGDSAMSRTVGLPAAIGAKRILSGEISQRGVLRPVIPEIYEPVLSELAEMGIGLTETVYQHSGSWEDG